MQLPKNLANITVAAALMVAAGPAKAALIEYRVSGTISDTSIGITEITSGDPFELSAIIDTAAPDNVAFTNFGQYLLAVQTFSFSVGAFSGGGDNSGSEIQVIDDPSQERLGFSVAADPALAVGGMPNGQDFTVINLAFHNSFMLPTPGALNSDGLGPALVASLDGLFGLAEATFGIGPIVGDGFRENAKGRIALVEIFDVPTNDIPEPASMALFGVGLAGLGLMRRRRKLH